MEGETGVSKSDDAVSALLFSKLDIDGNGTISRDEWRGWIRERVKMLRKANRDK